MAADPGGVEAASPARPGRRAGLASLGIALLIIGAFGAFTLYRSRQVASNPPARVTVSGESGNLTPGSAAPDFTATAFDGSTVRLSSFRGKVVLVNFFANWCVECRAEMPAIEAQYQARMASGFAVVGVDAFDNTDDGKAFYRQMGATFPAVADPQSGSAPGAIARAFGIATPSLPISVFIDRDGRVHQVFPGGIDAAVIRDQLRQMGIA